MHKGDRNRRKGGAMEGDGVGCGQVGADAGLELGGHLRAHEAHQRAKVEPAARARSERLLHARIRINN